jgi:hypothetical protein
MSRPLFLVLLVACRVALRNGPRNRDAHRVRGVFSVVVLLSPVESSVPPELS